jgi:uncharacterized protein YacL
MKPQDLESLISGIFNDPQIVSFLAPITKFLVVIITLLASFSRYIGIISKKSITNRAREFSFNSIMIGVELIFIIYSNQFISLQQWGIYTISYSYLIPGLILLTLFLYAEWKYKKALESLDAITTEYRSTSILFASLFISLFVTTFISITFRTYNYPTIPSVLIIIIYLIIFLSIYRTASRFKDNICEQLNKVIVPILKSIV